MVGNNTSKLAGDALSLERASRNDGKNIGSCMSCCYGIDTVLMLEAPKSSISISGIDGISY